MKINSKYVYVLSAFFILAIVISSVGAADLAKGDFGNENFQIDIPSGSEFTKEATTKLNIADMAMNIDVFENKGKNADDVSSIIYMKDGTPENKMVSEMFEDLKKDGKVLEETDSYLVVETKNSNDFFNVNIGSGFDDLWNFANGLFSSNDNSVNVSTQDADVQVSSEKGINIADNENNTVSISSEGLNINDANGEDISISTNGIKVSGEDSDGESADAFVSVDADAIENVDDGDYSICIKNSANDQVIVITGNNLELMKSMAETASFNEN